MKESKIIRKKKEKPKYDLWQNSAYMISLAWKEREKKVLVLALLSAIFVVATDLVNLYISPSILSAVERRVSMPELLATILLFVGLLMLCSAVSRYLNINLSPGRIQVRMALIAALNRKMATTSYPNVTDEQFRKLCTKAGEATDGNSQSTEAIWNTLTNLLKNVLGFVIYMLLLFFVDIWMVLVIMVTAVIGYVVNKHLYDYEYRHREELAEYEKQVLYIRRNAEDISAGKDIRLFGIRPWFEEVRTKAMQALVAFYKRANRAYRWAKIADLILTFLRNGVAYAYLLRFVLGQGLSASEFLLYFTAVGGFAQWITRMLNDMTILYKQSLDISTVRECLEYPEVFDLEGGEPLKAEPNGSYEIRLEDVSFCYPESENNILEHINLTLHPGEKLAVVGLNGAGKTTLVKVLCGFYDPTRGRVLLNGRDIREYNRRDYYRLFSAVFQDFSLLAATIAVNVAQSEDGIDMVRVRECAKKAGLLQKIESLPAGFETCLNRQIYDEAISLSGGETQRLMLARALYKDAPVLLLDEPTAALDPIAEAELYQKYSEMTEGRTSIYISHRLASTRFCDRIIFLEKNHITEEGTHEELLALGGRYAQLYEIQSKYYREEADSDEA